MFEGYDFEVIRTSLPYLFREGMTFTVTLTLIAMTGGIIFGTLLALMRRIDPAPLWARRCLEEHPQGDGYRDERQR